MTRRPLSAIADDFEFKLGRTRPNIPQPLAGMAHDLASFAAILLALGGVTIILFAIGGTPT